MKKKKTTPTIKTTKITGLLGIISAVIGLIGVILCCNVLFVTLLGTGIALVIIQHNLLFLGIGIGLILFSLVIHFFGKKKTCVL
jgi:hypothetical protein